MLRGLRGKTVSYVPQDPGGALNPSLRIGDAILDVLRAHRAGGRSDESVHSALARVELGSDPRFSHRYPHQLSGGQQQRVTIAMACVCDPPVAVLDEPTTGLRRAHPGPHPGRAAAPARRGRDGDGLRHPRPGRGGADGRPDRRHVRRAHRRGRPGRRGDRAAAASLHPGAGRGDPRLPPSPRAARDRRRLGRRRRLAGRMRVRAPVRAPAAALRGGAARPRADRPRPQRPLRALDGARPARARGARRPRLARRRPRAAAAPSWPSRASRPATARAVRRVPPSTRVSFTVEPGRCVALVGESGSGKTTIGRCIAGLHIPAAGTIAFDGAPVAGAARQRPLEVRRRIQIVFQNPFESLNPRQRVRAAIVRPLRVLRRLSRAEADARGRRAARAREAADAPGRPLPGRALGRRAPAGRDRARPRRAGRIS